MHRRRGVRPPRPRFVRDKWPIPWSLVRGAGSPRRRGQETVPWKPRRVAGQTVPHHGNMGCRAAIGHEAEAEKFFGDLLKRVAADRLQIITFGHKRSDDYRPGAGAEL